MSAGNLLLLLLLAAIWGGSFISMRILVVPFGAVLTAAARPLIAGAAMWLGLLVIGRNLQWRRYWKHYLAIGCINSALPFALFGFAANHLPASYSAILNSTSPLFGAILSAVWLSEPLTMKRIEGILLGTAGVAAVAGVGTAGALGPLFFWAVAGCLLAAFCYAVSAVYIRRVFEGLDPLTITAATQLAAGAMLMPVVAASPPAGPFTAVMILHLALYALLCSGIAFLIYFRLIATVGPTKALTVTFLMPPFGMIFGAIFIGEPITLQMALGCALVLAGTGLVLAKSGTPQPSATTSTM